MIRSLLIASLALMSHGQRGGGNTWTCTDFLNDGVRNCCPTTGVCQDSSCVVFGFPNSAKANCHTSGANPNCPDSYCNWKVPTCPEVPTQSNHCYGRVACKDGGSSCYGYGELCLEDGNSANFKICAGDCKKDSHCPRGDICYRKGNTATCVTGPTGPIVGWNLNVRYQRTPLSPATAVQILKQRYPELIYVKLFDYNASMITALRNAGVKDLVVSIPNDEFNAVLNVNKYLENIVNGLSGLVNGGIRVTLAIGNEPTLARYGNTYSPNLLPVLRATRAALVNKGFDNVKLTVPFDASILGASYPPTDGALRDEVRDVVRDVAQFLAAEGSPFFVNLYTYFAYISSLSTPYPIRLPYALLQEGHTATDQITYPNMLAAQVAAVRAALLKVDNTLTESRLRIIVGEAGWPSAGEQSATVDNARLFLTGAAASGVDIYLFEAFDEALKSEGSGSGSGVNDATEAHYGWLNEDGTPKFPLTAPQGLVCDQKYPPEGGEFKGLSCPPTVLQGWLGSGACVKDEQCGTRGVITCPSVPKSQVIASCPQFVAP